MVIKAFSPCESTRETSEDRQRRGQVLFRGFPSPSDLLQRSLYATSGGPPFAAVLLMGPCCFLGWFSLIAHLLNDSSPKLILVSLFLTFICSHGLLSCPMTSATLGCRQGDNIIQEDGT